MADKKISELTVASAIQLTDVSVLVHTDTDYQFTMQLLLDFLQANLVGTAQIMFGSTPPLNGDGNDGDVYFHHLISDTSNALVIYQKETGIWNFKVSIPLYGPDGCFLYGTGSPSNALGAYGDAYLDTNTGIFYAKTGTWAQKYSMATGPAGATGAAGTNGTNGTNGKTVLSGTASPSNTTDGVNGDFYIKTSTYEIFGPKAAGVWGIGTSLFGPGVPIGGTTGQVLRKQSDDNGDTFWDDEQDISGKADITYVDSQDAVLLAMINTIASQLTTKANDADVVHNTGSETIAGAKTFSSVLAAAGFNIGSNPVLTNTNNETRIHPYSLANGVSIVNYADDAYNVNIDDSGNIIVRNSISVASAVYTAALPTSNGTGFIQGYNVDLSSNAPITRYTGPSSGIKFDSNGYIYFYANGSQSSGATLNPSMIFSNLGNLVVGGNVLANAGFSDGYVSYANARIDRTGGNVEMQFTGDAGVRMFGFTSTPIQFNTNGGASFSNALAATAYKIGSSTVLDTDGFNTLLYAKQPGSSLAFKNSGGSIVFAVDDSGNQTVNGYASVHGSLEAYGVVVHRSDVQVLNKAANGWVTWAARNTSGAESLIDLSNLSSIALSGVGATDITSDTNLRLVSSAAGILFKTGGTNRGFINNGGYFVYGASDVDGTANKAQFGGGISAYNGSSPAITIFAAVGDGLGKTIGVNNSTGVLEFKNIGYSPYNKYSFDGNVSVSGDVAANHILMPDEDTGLIYKLNVKSGALNLVLA